MTDEIKNIIETTLWKAAVGAAAMMLTVFLYA